MSTLFKAGKFSGIRYREHPTRKNGIRKDRYFVLRYKLNGKTKEEAFGWESEGFTEKDAYDILCTIKQNIKTGNGYFSLKEKRETELAQRKKESEKNMTLDSFFINYYIPNHLNNKNEKTKINQTGLYNKHIKGSIGHKQLNDITRFDIEEIKSVLKKENYAAASINYIIGIIKNIFNRAQEYEFFDKKNPANAIEQIKKDNKRTRWLTRSEAETLLKTLKSMKLIDVESFAYQYYKKFETSQLYEMALLGLYCGLRAGEICKLTPIDINFETKQIFVKDTKNTKSRFVPMPNIVNKTLKQRIDNIKMKPNEYLFRTNDGKKMKEISDQFYRIVNRMGFNDDVSDSRQKVVFHTLRHTYASWLTQAGVNKYIVQKLLGHQKGEMTDRYSHLAPENFAQAADILNF